MSWPIPILAAPFGTIALIIVPVLLALFVLTLVVRQYKRCPANRILVISGKVTGQRASKCMHGGGTFVVPLLQEYHYLSLEPLTIDIELNGALSKKNIRVNVPSTFTIGVSTDPTIMTNAAERLLGLRENEIASQARDIILGQLRLVIATLSIEEINQDREKFLDLVNKNVGFELNKIGLEVINVNIRDITDESGYIEAIGRKAAAEAINTAKVEVSEADREGAIGEATANREKEVRVAEQVAQSAIGQKQAEREKRIRNAQLEAEGVAGEAKAGREQEVVSAEQRALTEQGRKQAESEQRIRIADLESQAIEGENKSRASIAEYNATLAERQAEARRRGEVAAAEAARDVLYAEREQEVARLEKEQLAKQQVEKQRMEIDAEAEAEKQRRIARGQADATLARYSAEAEGVQKVLESKALGYQRLLAVCPDKPEVAASLLVIEKLPDLVAEQVKAISGLKIEKVTVWDGGSGYGLPGGGDGQGATAGFLRGLIQSLPPMHELARQAGIDLPEVLGRVDRAGEQRSTRGGQAAPASPTAQGGQVRPDHGGGASGAGRDGGESGRTST